MADVKTDVNQSRAMRIARRRVEGFAEQFGEAHRNLARHAAFPLVLTPDLLYQIWANFVPEVPWVAGAHVLLSRLCRQGGYEMYEIGIADRNLLLQELKEEFGQERFDELGESLLDYVAQRLNDDDADTQDLREAQEWTALAYTKPGEVARKLAQRLSEMVQQEDMGEVLRLTSLVETWAEPIMEAGFEPLLVYTNDIRNFLKTGVNKAINNPSKFLKHRNQLEINGVIIPIAQKIEINKLEYLLPNTPSEIKLTNSEDTTDIYSYLMKLEGEVLRVGFNRVLPAQSDQIVQDTLKQLEQMIDSGQIPGGSRILIDGPQSIPVAYVIAHKLAQFYEVVAVFDPSIGRGKNGYKTYIVTITNSQKYRVGDFIETKEAQQSKGSIIKVVLCGPPRSGKSYLRDGLKRAILGNLGAPYPYVITACPDGEGSWYQETYEINEELVKSIKPFYKADMTPEFATEAAKWVRSANQLINIIDVCGKISPENKIIMQPATHAVILSGDPDKFAEWEEFCQSIGLKVIAKIHSQLNVEQDEVFLPDNWKEKTNELLEKAPLLTGTVHKLERGENFSTRPMVQVLSEVLTRC